MSVFSKRDKRTNLSSNLIDVLKPRTLDTENRIDLDSSDEDGYNNDALVFGDDIENANAIYDYDILISLLDHAISDLEIHEEVGISKRKLEQSQNRTKSLLLQHISVKSYLQKRQNGQKKIEASVAAANEVYKNDKAHSFKSKSIRSWADYFAQHQTFKPMMKGKHAKTKTIIYDEEVQNLFKDRLSGMNEIEITPTRFMNLLNDSLLSEIPGAPPKVSKETCRRWLQTLGYSSNEEGKRHYVQNIQLT